MGKEFNKKYMHPTRRKLLDMVQTGEYDKNTTIGYTKVDEKRNVGDIWEDEHNRYEKKGGYILKTGKNSEAFDEIRKYLQKKSTCKNSECKTIKVTGKDKKFIEKGGYCMNCTIDIEHELRVKGLFQEYQDYKVYTRMLIYGKQKLEELKQSFSDVKPYYEYINEDGSTEKWELPTTVEEAKSEIQELIDNGQKELEEIEEKRIIAFAELKKQNLEHYL
jgi:hypothetical protein